MKSRWLGLGLLAIASLAIGLAVGEPVPIQNFFHENLIVNSRMPRVLLAGLIGGGLAAAGAAYQGLFRNPLADPFLIGTASGSSLGATLVMLIGASSGWLGMNARSAGAFVGALFATVIVYLTGTTGRVWNVGRLLLAGAAVGTILNALTWILLMRNEKDMGNIVTTLLGSLNLLGWPDLIAALPWLIVGFLGLIMLARPLDAMSLGDDAAKSIGLPLRFTVAMIMIFAGLLTAVCVATGGVIGFIGLVAPYLSRPLIGHRHLVVLPASALLGASLLILSDAIARVAALPGQLPVGVVTALLAGPFFLLVLKRGRL